MENTFKNRKGKKKDKKSETQKGQKVSNWLTKRTTEFHPRKFFRCWAKKYNSWWTTTRGRRKRRWSYYRWRNKVHSILSPFKGMCLDSWRTHNILIWGLRRKILKVTENGREISAMQKSLKALIGLAESDLMMYPWEVVIVSSKHQNLCPAVGSMPCLFYKSLVCSNKLCFFF